MIRPEGETRPRCRWPEHKWELDGYVVHESPTGKQTVVTRFKCPKCGRQNLEVLGRRR